MNIKYFFAFLAVLLISPNTLLAQDDNSSMDVEEVIVTATKRETNLMETPLAVSVVTQEQMALQGLSRISDLSSLVPNLQVGTSGEDSGATTSSPEEPSKPSLEFASPKASPEFELRRTCNDPNSLCASLAADN